MANINITFNNNVDGRTNNNATFVDFGIRRSNTNQNGIITWADKIDWGEFTLSDNNGNTYQVTNTYQSLIEALVGLCKGSSGPVLTQYTITFNSQGGSSVASITINAGSAIGTLPLPTYSGHTFNGWYTAASGGNQISASTIPTGSVTYYAHWTQNPVTQYTVAFNVNGGSGSVSSQTVNAGSSITLPSYSGTKSGYTFAGWTKDSTSGTTYTVGASFTPTANTTFYAKWTPNTVTQYWFSYGATEITANNYTTANGATQVSSYPSEVEFTPSSRQYIYILVKNDKTVQVIDSTTNAVAYITEDNTTISGYKIVKPNGKVGGKVYIRIS